MKTEPPQIVLLLLLFTRSLVHTPFNACGQVTVPVPDAPLPERITQSRQKDYLCHSHNSPDTKTRNTGSPNSLGTASA